MQFVVGRLSWLLARTAQLTASIMAASAVLAPPMLAEEWSTTEWNANCIEARDIVCDLEDSRVEGLLDQLSETSRTLEAIGFRPPQVSPEEGFLQSSPYIVHVQEPAIACDIGPCVGGYSFNDEILSVAYGLPVTLDEVLVHEVFHAVQAAYGVESIFMDDGKDWVLEGMAEALGLALSENQGASGHYGTPYLDYPQNDPATSAGTPADNRYATFPFWLYLAKRYGGAPPGRYHIFDVFLAEAERVSNALPSSGNSSPRGSVPIADAALKAFDPNGLYDIFPAFIAEVGNNRNFFESVVEVKPVLGQPGNVSVETEASVRPLAARAFTVSIPERASLTSTGSRAVEVRLVSDDPDALHLIVGDNRYDEVSGPNRNVYFEAGEDLDRELFIRVANVGRDPAAYKDQNFKLIVTVYHEYIEMTGPNSASPNDVGPDYAAIDAPITVSGRVFSQFWGPMRLRLILEAGLDQPCMFQLDAFGKDELIGVSLMLLQNGPMPPGDYPIAHPGPKEIVGQQDHARDYAGQVVATFVLDEKHPLVGEYGMQYMGQAGVLTIESISPHWVTGHVHIAGTWTTTRPTSLPYDAPPAGPTDLTIEMAFSVSNAAIASRVNTASCIGP